jgi:6-phosphogluconolactonase
MAESVSGYIGTYTRDGGRGKGVYRFTLNTGSGLIEGLELAAGAPNPSYLALSPSKKYLYAVNETAEFEGQEGGAVSAYAREGGGLRLINQKPSRGKHPCHIAIDGTESYAVAANYTSGTLSVYPLGPDGSLGDAAQVIQLSGKGPDPRRQEGPHAHSFLFDRSGAFGFACDLGTDRIMAYALDKNAPQPLSPAPQPWYSTEAGAGPRHGLFNPAGSTAYCLTEMGSTLEVLAYDPSRGSLERRQILSTLPPGNRTPSSASALRQSPDGKFLYASNRGHDSIAVFKTQPGAGEPGFVDALPSGGRTPRDFNIDPSGSFILALHQDSDNLVILRRDPATGLFRREREYAVPSPVSIIVV